MIGNGMPISQSSAPFPKPMMASTKVELPHQCRSEVQVPCFAARLARSISKR